MAAINDLINQIQDPALRAKIEQEVDKLTKQKKFGLVFEEHLPDTLALACHHKLSLRYSPIPSQYHFHHRKIFSLFHLYLFRSYIHFN